jgi:hypothetical protein
LAAGVVFTSLIDDDEAYAEPTTTNTLDAATSVAATQAVTRSDR